MCNLSKPNILKSKPDRTGGIKSDQKEIAAVAMESLRKPEIVSKHPSCTHSGYCGTHYHGSGGGGWCYYCRKCNPR